MHLGTSLFCRAVRVVRERAAPMKTGRVLVRPLPASVALVALAAGCSVPSAAPAPASSVSPTSSASFGSPTGSVASPTGAGPSAARIGAATAAPSWLGTRPLPVGPDGVAAARSTPPELRNRSIITVDDLPPPADGRFHATVEVAPAAVLARSSWSSRCPVKAADLRYVTVSFRGFDGLPHTGEMLVHQRAAKPLVTVFGQLFAQGYPIERMRITTEAELNAPPTGDDNTTDAYACRPVRGRKSWSQHAYGLAVDVNPFQNPYHRGKVVLPELSTSYLQRADVRRGMIRAGDPVVRAFASVGWKWGGDYHSLKDFMHFSATGG
jgi:hypothetical protein